MLQTHRIMVEILSECQMTKTLCITSFAQGGVARAFCSLTLSDCLSPITLNRAVTSYDEAVTDAVSKQLLINIAHPSASTHPLHRRLEYRRDVRFPRECRSDPGADRRGEQDAHAGLLRQRGG